MTPWTLAAGILAAGFCVAFAWPWVDPYLRRSDVKARLLDRLEEEWEREGEARKEPWNW